VSLAVGARTSSRADTAAQVDDCHAARQRLAAGLADSSSLVKGLVVRAEDARSRGDMYAPAGIA
jgi:hypothetical protein